jgi:hypothetical protein
MRWELVAVKWEDVTTLARFGLDTDFESKRLYKLSVGFLIEETDEYIVIADDMDLSGAPESANNYGTLVPKGCICDRRVIWPAPGNQVDLVQLGGVLATGDGDSRRKPSRRAVASLRRFFEHNPHVLADARQIARGLGMDEDDVTAQLGALERREVVQQLVGGVYVSAPGRKAVGPGRKRRRANPSR